MPDNPLLAGWLGPDEVPPFGRIAPEHFRPAFVRAMADQRAALARVATDPAAPSFDNTVAAIERSGRALARIDNVFSLLAGADVVAPDRARAERGHERRVRLAFFGADARQHRDGRGAREEERSSIWMRS